MVACAPGGGGSSGSSAAGTGASTPGITSTANTLTGVVHGGNSPIMGATVDLYEAGPLGTPPTAPLLTTTTDTNGNYSFSNVAASCTSPTSSALLYVVASSGNPGAGTNPAINLMAAIGACNNLPSYVVINELTTVAAVYALNGFSYQPVTGTGSGNLNGCVDCIPTAATAPSDMTKLNGNAPGINNAFLTVANLVDVATGNPASWLPTSGACSEGASLANCTPLEKLTGLANALAACVNSTNSAQTPSEQCTQLFACATAGATIPSGTACVAPAEATQPSDTLAATLSIARNPGLVEVSGLANIPGGHVVFGPGLLGAPTDWTIALTYDSGEGVTSEPAALAVDASGDVWVADYVGANAIEFSPTGSELQTVAVGNGADAVAIDGKGNVFVGNYADNSLTQITGSTTYTIPEVTSDAGVQTLDGPTALAVQGDQLWVANAYSGIATANGTATALPESDTGGQVVGTRYLTFYGIGLDSPTGIAGDINGNLWFTNFGGTNAVTLFTPANDDAYSSVSGFDGPYAIATDGMGNAWVANRTGSSVVEIPATNYLAASPITLGGLNVPDSIAVDGLGNVWVANEANSVTELNSAGAPLSPSTGFTTSGFNQPYAVAVDPSGDVWIANYGAGSVSEIVGAAAPTVTPVEAQIQVWETEMQNGTEGATEGTYEIGENQAT